MTDEIDRLEALLREATPGPWEATPDCVVAESGVVANAPRLTQRRAVGGPFDAKAIAALGSVWPELLEVAQAWRDARDGAVGRMTDDGLRVSLRGDDWGRVCKAEEALRARIREVLGEADNEPEPVRCEDCDCPNDPRRWACDRCGAGLPEGDGGDRG